MTDHICPTSVSILPTNDVFWYIFVDAPLFRRYRTEWQERWPTRQDTLRKELLGLLGAPGAVGERFQALRRLKSIEKFLRSCVDDEQRAGVRIRGLFYSHVVSAGGNGIICSSYTNRNEILKKKRFPA